MEADAKTKRIEKLICDIKFGDFSESKKECKRIELSNLLLSKIKNGGLILRLMSDAKSDLSVKEEKVDNGYDAIAFAQAYNYAYERYGDVDKDTNERILFIQLFLSAYNIKCAGIKETKLNSSPSADYFKKDIIILFLKKIKEENKITQDLPRKNFASKDKCINLLREWGVYDKYIDTLDEIFETSYTARDSLKSDSENDQDTYNVVDASASKEHQLHDIVEEKISRLFEKFLISSNEDDKKIGKIHFYLVVLEQADEDTLDRYQEFIDIGFKKFCDKYTVDYVLKNKNEVAGEYLNYKPDTMRKKFKAIEKALLRVAACGNS